MYKNISNLDYTKSYSSMHDFSPMSVYDAKFSTLLRHLSNNVFWAEDRLQIKPRSLNLFNNRHYHHRMCTKLEKRNCTFSHSSIISCIICSRDDHSRISFSSGLINGEPSIVNDFRMWSSSSNWISSIDVNILSPYNNPKFSTILLLALIKIRDTVSL